MTAGRRLLQLFEHSGRVVLYPDQDGKPRLWNHPCSYSTAKWFWHMLGIYPAIIQEPCCAQIIPGVWNVAFHIPRYKRGGVCIFCWNNSIFCKYTLTKLQWSWHYILTIDLFSWDVWTLIWGHWHWVRWWLELTYSEKWVSALKICFRIFKNTSKIWFGGFFRMWKENEKSLLLLCRARDSSHLLRQPYTGISQKDLC